MRNITLYAALIVILLGTSCKKQLEVANPNTLTTQQFWKSANDAKLGINAVYGNFYRIGGYARWIHFNQNLRSDEGTSNSPWLELQNWQKFLIVNSNFDCGIQTWHDHYTGIYRANQVIDNVPQINMDATLKKQYVAEAKFLRALYYFNLTTLWGNVPLALKTSTTTDVLPYSTNAQDWSQIEKDLQEAIPDLPAKYSDAEIGRATKGAAYALLGKAYLQQLKYTEAKAAFDWLVVGDGKQYYDLVPNYQDNFTDLHENNIESVFEVQFSSQNKGADVDGPGSSDGDERAQFFGPRGVGWSDAQATRFIVTELSKEKNINSDRDPRLPVTAIFDSLDVRGPEFSMVFGQSFKSRGYGEMEVWFHKYEDDYAKNTEDYYSPINFRIIRFADVLLMYAECLNGLGQTLQAYQYVDRVRHRSNMALLSTIKSNMSQADFLTQLQHERVTELAGEGTRWNDMARWGFLEDVNKIKEIALHDPDFNNFMVGRDKYLPIPQSEIDLNPNLKQNPGY